RLERDVRGDVAEIGERTEPDGAVEILGIDERERAADRAKSELRLCKCRRGEQGDRERAENKRALHDLLRGLRPQRTGRRPSAPPAGTVARLSTPGRA